ncbi:MAG: type I glyceraldehyde-3-phosphate dehydrogenase [Candidatus Buchananbacteria bacterium]|jgi:glyceraldehyde 3-phosphate dehydrogenase
MPIKIAINGFGRMGRLIFRKMFDDPAVQIVAINSPSSVAFYAHLLKYDSCYGIWDKDVSAEETKLLVDGKSIPLYCHLTPLNCPWRELEVDIVIESTGVFRSRADSELHLKAGAKRIIITAPAKDEDITLVPGVNLDAFDPASHVIISSASCTSNCLAPIIKTIQPALKIKHGYMVTVHAYTNDQHLVDAPHKKEDFRRARAATESIIPTDTGATKTIGKLIPELAGRLSGIAMRVPVVLPSVINLALEVEKSTTAEAVNKILKDAAMGELKGIMDFSTLPLVSVDYRGNPCASIIDGLLTEVVDETMVNIVSWYDNEWGYINQLSRVIKHVGKN